MGDLFGVERRRGGRRAGGGRARSAEGRRAIADLGRTDDDDERRPRSRTTATASKPDASMSDLFGADSDEEPAQKDETHKMEDLFGADSDEDKPAESKHRMEDLFGDDDEDEPVQVTGRSAFAAQAAPEEAACW